MSHLTRAADAHVQGLGVTARPVQHLGRQLHHEARGFCFALERAGVFGVIVHGQPLVVLTLVAHVCMGRTLLGPEVAGIWGAVLRQTRESKHFERGKKS